MPAYILTEETLTLMSTEGPKVTHSNNPNWDSVLGALKEKDFVLVEELIDLESAVKSFVSGRMEVRDGAVWFDGQPIHNSLTDRILRMMGDGFDIEPMVKFLHRLMKNPSKRSVDDLYRFMEHNLLPLTEDGHFLAYKNVRDNFTDYHSGTFDNSIGAVCQMPRNQVQDDPDVTCSSGLHFCSIEYLNNMWGHGGHTMIIKIDPADVVSIPVDYNNAKGRTCRYTVIAEHFDKDKDTVSESSVYFEEDFCTEYDCDFNDDGDCALEE